MNRQEDINAKEEKNSILEMLKQGFPVRKIERDLGIARSRIKKIKMELIKEGEITQQEIDEAWEKYHRDNPAAQGLDKSKARKPKGNEKSTARHNRVLDNQKRVLELLREGKNQAEIARILQLSETSVHAHVNVLIQQGRINDEDIKRGGKPAGNMVLDKNGEDYTLKRDKIVQYLRLGWKNDTIRKKLGIASSDFNFFIIDIKYKKIMTSEEIKKAREKRRQDDLRFVAEHIRQGYSQTQIRKLRPEFSYNEITPLIKELIATGQITKEQIDQNGKNNSSKTRNKNRIMTLEEQQKYVAQKVKEGFSPQEIVDSDETDSLNMHRVLYLKKKIIDLGIVSEEDANLAMKKRQQILLDKKHDIAIEEIKKYTMQGYTIEEMSRFMDYGMNTLYKIRSSYIAQHGWFSKDELESFKQNRKARIEEEKRIAFDSLPEEEKQRILEEKRRKEEENRREAQRKKESKQKEKNNKYGKDLAEIKEYLLSGMTMKEIAEKLQCSIAYIYLLRKESIKKGTWIDEEQINLIRNQKREKAKAETQARNKKKKREQDRTRKQEQKKQNQEEMKAFLNYVKNGYTYEEIAKKMSYSVSHISKIRKSCVENGFYFTKEEIKYFKKQRKVREKSETEKKQRKAQRELDAERRAFEGQIKAEQIAKKRKIAKLKDPYRRARKKARHEDFMELNGEENVSTSGRKEFIQLLIEMYEAGAEIDDKSLELASNAIYSFPELTKSKLLKIIIMDAYKKGELPAAIKKVNELISFLNGTKYYKYLVEFKTYIRNKALEPKILELKDAGKTNNEIAKIFKITSVEVGRIVGGDSLTEPEQK